MYDEYARQLIDLLPELPEIDRVACRRALSTAYFYIVRSRLKITQDSATASVLEEVQRLLRRMVDALESVAVFDRLYGQIRSVEVENACAFVAAEALALLANLLPPHKTSTLLDPLLQESNYTALEAALLYMIGGYEINAVSIMQEIEIPDIREDTTSTIATARMVNARYVLTRIKALCQGDVRQPRLDNLSSLDYNGEVPNDYEVLIDQIRVRFYHKIGTALDAYLDWLGGYEENGREIATSLLQAARYASTASGYPGYTPFADIYHLSSLLLAAIDRTHQHALLHNVPLPQGADAPFLQQFHAYLKHRAQGDENHKGRPFLWQSSLEYVKQCLPGPAKDAVISMPTGSGKSFIAELAIGHALCSGWILYLAPTNALVYQIRRDLKYALKPFEISLRTFVGNEEYTTLTEEQINLEEENFVVVMTPEKCALALRLYPEQFSRCSLCVFDECHLLQDRQRGFTADWLIAQLSFVASNIRFILMSAMVSNPDELAGWLQSIRKTSSIPITIKWRPSRTMRGFLVVDQKSFKQNYDNTKTKLLQKEPSKKRISPNFDAPLALIVGLSGPWTLDGKPDYCTTLLPIAFPQVKAVQTATSWKPEFEGWKNAASRLLSEQFAKTGISVICFILSSRHHTFSNAEKISEEISGAIRTEAVFQALATFPPLVEAWLSIAEHELGVTTVLRELLLRGIAVHHSAMLQVEQAASEWMFSQRKARLMFATGTLAQGLNFPATAVVIAGTKMGDSRKQEVDTIAGISRSNTMILNSFGRAGRPGFSNQGIAVLVSDEPYYQDMNPTNILNNYKLLGEPDATEDIHSPVEKFLDTVIAGDIDITRVGENERILISQLAEYSSEEHHAGQILSRTLAAYHKRDMMSPQVIEQIRARVATVKQVLLQQPDAPEWINKAAMKAGVDFFHAYRMWQAYQQRGVVSLEESATFQIKDWLQVFFEVMGLLPPKKIDHYLEREGSKRDTVLTRMRDLVMAQRDCDMIPWNIPDNWRKEWQELQKIVFQYMQGASYATIASLYLGKPIEEITPKRSKGDQPIPAIFSFLQKIVNPLSIDAGCFLAISECMVKERDEGNLLPETLQALPLCIRNGCDSLGTLSWYRFGYRQRVCAHALAQRFPLPQELKNDTERAEWVRQARHDWLSGELSTENTPLLEYAKTVILESEPN